MYEDYEPKKRARQEDSEMDNFLEEQFKRIPDKDRKLAQFLNHR